MRARVARSQTNQSCARMRVKVRRALAHQVRSPQSAVRASVDACSLFHQSFVRVASVFDASAELISKPAQGKSCGLRDAHDMPAPRDGVTESVYAPARV